MLYKEFAQSAATPVTKGLIPCGSTDNGWQESCNRRATRVTDWWQEKHQGDRTPATRYKL